MSTPDPWLARVVTCFPRMFPGPLALSLAGRALTRGLWRLETLDIRAFASDRHRTIDDAPYGGGHGMVLRPDIVDRAMNKAQGEGLLEIALTPRGAKLSQQLLRQWAVSPGIVLLCGRYEGIDERVIHARGMSEVSLGDFVLSGGEPAAMAILDGCVRLLPGVAASSLEEESFENGLLEHPQFTRPRIWQGFSVPEVLVSGDHGRIRRWQNLVKARTTRARRPDLWRRWVEARDEKTGTKRQEDGAIDESLGDI